MVAGAMLGLGEVLEPSPPKEAVVEPELLGEPPLDQPVQFIMMPGLPQGQPGDHPAVAAGGPRRVPARLRATKNGL